MWHCSHWQVRSPGFGAGPDHSGCYGPGCATEDVIYKENEMADGDDRLIPWPKHNVCKQLDVVGELSKSLIALGYQEQSSQAQMSVRTFWDVLNGVLVKADNGIDFRYGVEFTILLYRLYVTDSPRWNALEAEGGSSSSIPDVLHILQRNYCNSPSVSNNLHPDLVGNKRVAMSKPDIPESSSKNPKIAGMIPLFCIVG